MKRHFIFLLFFLCNLFACDSESPINDTDDEIKEEPTFQFSDYEWSSYNSSVFSSNLQDEALTLTLQQNAAWFNEETGGLYYIAHFGDFDFSATVHTTMFGTASAPEESYSFGGLVARDASSEDQNYVHVVTGTGINTESPKEGYEYKVTRNSSSQYEITHDGSNYHDLRLKREANTFSFYHRAANSDDNWTLITSTEQSLSPNIQLGFTIYTAHNAVEVIDMQVTYSNISLQ